MNKTTMPSPEDSLRKQLHDFNAVGQVSTLACEEVLCTDNDPEIAIHTSHLTAAFVEADQLAQTLKLGSLRKVIIGSSTIKPIGYDDDDEGGISNSNSNSNRNSNNKGGEDRNNKSSSSSSSSSSSLPQNDFVVQSKVYESDGIIDNNNNNIQVDHHHTNVDDENQQTETDALITTTIASSLPAVLMGDKAMTITTQKVLQ